MSKRVIVTMQHVREAGLCVRGAKVWFERQGLDFASFLRNGMPLAEVDKIGDALAHRVAAHVRKKMEEGGV